MVFARDLSERRATRRSRSRCCPRRSRPSFPAAASSAPSPRRRRARRRRRTTSPRPSGASRTRPTPSPTSEAHGGHHRHLREPGGARRGVTALHVGARGPLRGRGGGRRRGRAGGGGPLPGGGRRLRRGGVRVFFRCEADASAAAAASRGLVAAKRGGTFAGAALRGFWAAFRWQCSYFILGNRAPS